MTFENWLYRQGYKRSSVRVSTRHVATAQRVFADGGAAALEELSYAFPALRRYMAWAAKRGLRSAFLRALSGLGLEAVSGAPASAPRNGQDAPKRPERLAYPPEALEALCAFWVRSSRGLAGASPNRESLVLLCMLQSGRRVGDVLALTLREVRKLDEQPWPRMADAMKEARVRLDGTVASWLSEQPDASPLAGDAAYQRINRYHRRSCEALDIAEPHNLERLRVSP